MKEMNKKIQYKGNEYALIFNLNVMEVIQNEYGSLDRWGTLTDGSDKNGEPDAKAVIFGFTAMINEGIDIANEDNGTDIKPFTEKQVGRLITEIGMKNATSTLNEAVMESTKSDEKNS